MQREVSHRRIALCGFLVVLHLKGYRRIVFYVEKVGIPQVGIAFFVIRIHRPGLDCGLNGLHSAGFGIHVDKPGIVHEPACGLRHDHVRDAKLDRRMVRIQVPTGWLCVNHRREPDHRSEQQEQAPTLGSSLQHELPPLGQTYRNRV